jgi:hypothetical protein
MKKLLIKICYSVFLGFVVSCSDSPNNSKPDATDSEKPVSQESGTKGELSQNPTADKKTLIAPVYYKTAFDMASAYQKEFNPNGDRGDYVWTDLASLKTMVEAFEANNDTLVRIYFGIDKRAICGVPRKNLTVFFEGAKSNESCQLDKCYECKMNENTDTTNFKPYDVAQPCPPPPCGGFSRYYIYTAGQVRVPRTSRFDPNNPTK